MTTETLSIDPLEFLKDGQQAIKFSEVHMENTTATILEVDAAEDKTDLMRILQHHLRENWAGSHLTEEIGRIGSLSVYVKFLRELNTMGNLRLEFLGLLLSNLSWADTECEALESLGAIYTKSRADKILNLLQPHQILIPDRVAVSNYLTDYPDIAQILPFVCQISRERVPPDTELSLQVYASPEDGDTHLSLYLRPQEYDDKLFDTINSIEAGYIDKLSGKSGWILVTTDFQDPNQG